MESIEQTTERTLDRLICQNPEKVDQAKKLPALRGWFAAQVQKEMSGMADADALNAAIEDRFANVA